MISHSFILICLFTFQLSVLSKGQPNVGYDQCDYMRQGFFNHYYCTLQCFGETLHLTYVKGDLCKETVEFASKHQANVPLPVVGEVLECITVRCKSTLPPSVCGYGNGFLNKNEDSQQSQSNSSPESQTAGNKEFDDASAKGFAEDYYNNYYYKDYDINYDYMDDNYNSKNDRKEIITEKKLSAVDSEKKSDEVSAVVREQNANKKSDDIYLDDHSKEDDNVKDRSGKDDLKTTSDTKYDNDSDKNSDVKNYNFEESIKQENKEEFIKEKSEDETSNEDSAKEELAVKKFNIDSIKEESDDKSNEDSTKEELAVKKFNIGSIKEESGDKSDEDSTKEESVIEKSNEDSTKEKSVVEKSNGTVTEESVVEISKEDSTKQDSFVKKSNNSSAKEDSVVEKPKADSTNKESTADKSKEDSTKEEAVEKPIENVIKGENVTEKSNENSTKEESTVEKSNEDSMKEESAAEKSEDDLIKEKSISKKTNKDSTKDESSISKSDEVSDQSDSLKQKDDESFLPSESVKEPSQTEISQDASLAENAEDSSSTEDILPIEISEEQSSAVSESATNVKDKHMASDHNDIDFFKTSETTGTDKIASSSNNVNSNMNEDEEYYYYYIPFDYPDSPAIPVDKNKINSDGNRNANVDYQIETKNDYLKYNSNSDKATVNYVQPSTNLNYQPAPHTKPNASPFNKNDNYERFSGRNNDFASSEIGIGAKATENDFSAPITYNKHNYQFLNDQPPIGVSYPIANNVRNSNHPSINAKNSFQPSVPSEEQYPFRQNLQKNNIVQNTYGASQINDQTVPQIQYLPSSQNQFIPYPYANTGYNLRGQPGNQYWGPPGIPTQGYNWNTQFQNQGLPPKPSNKLWNSNSNTNVINNQQAFPPHNAQFLNYGPANANMGVPPPHIYRQSPPWNAQSSSNAIGQPTSWNGNGPSYPPPSWNGKVPSYQVPSSARSINSSPVDEE